MKESFLRVYGFIMHDNYNKLSKLMLISECSQVCNQLAYLFTAP